LPRALHLHARSITLPKGVPGAGVRIVAPPPEHFRKTLALFEFETGAEAEDPFREWDQ
jgi:hypothetical protein